MSQSNSLNVNSIFGAAAQQSIISPASLQVLTAVDLGAQIQNALGVSADAIDASEVFLLNVLLDDSSSISKAGNEDILCQGTNLILDALTSSKAENDILVHVATLNRGTLFPFTPIRDVSRLSSSNFTASGNTPLYDRAVESLATILAKEREFAANGVPVRTSTLIVTDGADYGSRRSKPRDVATVVADLKRRENHNLVGMGIDDKETDFRAVFRSMGIDDRWILTPKNDPHSIRQAFEVYSKSSVQASQGAKAFSQMNGLPALPSP